jgi:hypothetical protein
LFALAAAPLRVASFVADSPPSADGALSRFPLTVSVGKPSVLSTFAFARFAS